ncbi:hypothetical protein BDU57DRAFT_553762 [Ampelomyces quisqualis]|uniref:Survival Motor Neuron Gemin2-binding domain-containing protein n=1 Tax=Ampelomyces quisqualis TaxID=50730 RepID=A0A6A5R2Q6_AMPQU|nr:hypothetical protein BDU57DRAFT_553762 [Ampelomyces quisqualis]
MAPGIDLSDRNAWDDSYLVRSWDDAVKEYEKYHSIHKSGKRLEDALSADELKKLREDYGEYLEETETPSVAAETNGHADRPETEMIYADVNGVEAVTARQQDPNSSKQQEVQPANTKSPARQEAAPACTMSEALLGTVQDENLKNMMMSWYYAGYYTGLHAGQQQTLKDGSPKQQ